MRGKESRAQRVMEYSFLSSIPPKPRAVAFLAVYYWQRKCWFMVWVTGNLVSWWRNKPGGAASALLCQFLPHALLLGLPPEQLRRGRANSGLTSEVTFPWNWIQHRLFTVPLQALPALTPRYLSIPSPPAPSLHPALQPHVTTPRSLWTPCIFQSLGLGSRCALPGMVPDPVSAHWNPTHASLLLRAICSVKPARLPSIIFVLFLVGVFSNMHKRGQSCRANVHVPTSRPQQWTGFSSLALSRSFFELCWELLCSVLLSYLLNCVGRKWVSGFRMLFTHLPQWGNWGPKKWSELPNVIRQVVTSWDQIFRKGFTV